MNLQLSEIFFPSTEGFTIKLKSNNWAALYPNYHFMFVSKSHDRVKQLCAEENLKKSTVLNDLMKKSFVKYFDRRDEKKRSGSLFRNKLLSSAICIIPTNDCNLGCQYCFAATEPKKEGVIKWEIAKAAVDLGIRNAILNRMMNGTGQFELRFFGGGEPTDYWEEFEQIVIYARRMAKEKNVKCLISKITNGQIDKKNYQWIRRNIDEIYISFDGPPEIQNKQRPTHDGRESFTKSWKFLEAMDTLDVKINSIRVTTTAESVKKMVEIAEFFWTNLSKQHPLQFEPVYLSEVGRKNVLMPSAKDFVENFRAVEIYAAQRKGLVSSATKPLTIRNGSYCDSLEGKGLFITPDGCLSLCSEISALDDPRKDRYFVGEYNEHTNQFELSKQGESIIREGLPSKCESCFAKFNCSGGCEPRSMNSDTKIRKAWCSMVKMNLLDLWDDVFCEVIGCRERIVHSNGDELIWLPIWESVK